MPDARADSPLTPDVDPTAEAAPVDAAAPRPDLDRTRAAVDSPRALTRGVTVLSVLAVLYTLYFAREFLLPITFAVLLSFVLSPLVRMLARLRLRPPLGAALVMVVLLGAVGTAVYELGGPVQTWAADAPKTLTTARGKLRRLLRPLERVQRTAEQVQSAATVTDAARQPQTVVVQGPTLLQRIFGRTQRFLAGLLEVVILLYFLLAAGDLFLQKLIKVLPGSREKTVVVQIARETEASISAYLLTASAVFATEGVVVALAMWLLGMPNPALWGALVALLEFIPYLGAATMVAILTVAALTTFDSPGRALLVPATFIAITVVQANFVSPVLLGRRLSLNPVAVLVGLAFWFWMWGVPGAFIAVPLLAAFKILCDHIAPLASVGEFLGERDEGERRAMVRERAELRLR